jgi:hypothetical protein
VSRFVRKFVIGSCLRISECEKVNKKQMAKRGKEVIVMKFLK